MIWPKQAIAQALGMAGQIQGFYAQIRAHFPNPDLQRYAAEPEAA